MDKTTDKTKEEKNTEEVFQPIRNTQGGEPVEPQAQDRAEEYLSNWKRERADFINYKKDEVKRLSEFAKFAEEGIVLEIVELIDDLETASKEIRNPGLDQVVKKFEEFLKKRNVERIDTGGAFDPLLHEAMITEEGGGKMEEVRAGYKMHNKVIRPARVKIVK